MLALNSATLSAHLGEAPNSTIPYTLLDFPGHISWRGLLKASEKHIINLVLLLFLGFCVIFRIMIPLFRLYIPVRMACK